ncbi:hypothetical protein Syun_029536 [Stephania yunnanensis]|uniref:Uncharacterized protein n=1 Tax=Stephania yunnanensis TaxID=152371 RepID=A0AAP0E951_9MAGN
MRRSFPSAKNIYELQIKVTCSQDILGSEVMTIAIVATIISNNHCWNMGTIDSSNTILKIKSKNN